MHLLWYSGGGSTEKNAFVSGIVVETAERERMHFFWYSGGDIVVETAAKTKCVFFWYLNSKYN